MVENLTMKLKLLTIAVILQSTFVFSQEKITYNPKSKYVFEQGTEKYKISQANQVFKNPTALEHITKGKNNRTAALVFSGVGGFSLGWGIGQALFNQDKGQITMTPNGTVTSTKKQNKGWGFIISGLVLAGVGFPFQSAANKNFKKAVNIENGESLTSFKPYIDISSTENGLSLNYNF